MYKDFKISVVIPALNEELAIGRVLEALPSKVVDEMIVVDNGSTDNTISEALKKGAKVVREEAKGYGAACLKGINEMIFQDIVVILDADYSDYPEQIVRLLEPIVEENIDFTIGSRLLGKREKGALTPQQYWGNKLACFLIYLFYGHNFTDMGPFRAIKYQAFKTLEMKDKNFGWNVEMQIKAIKLGLKIKEIPVDYRKRLGYSKISGTLIGTLLAGYKILYTVFKYVYEKKPS